MFSFKLIRDLSRDGGIYRFFKYRYMNRVCTNNCILLDFDTIQYGIIIDKPGKTISFGVMGDDIFSDFLNVEVKYGRRGYKQIISFAEHVIAEVMDLSSIKSFKCAIYDVPEEFL